MRPGVVDRASVKKEMMNNMKIRNALRVLACVIGAVPVVAVATGVEIGTVLVGDPGNPHHSDRWGAVSYEYRIGVYPVTNNQYVAFLNSVAVTDTHGLYNPEMTNSVHGGVTRSGSSGSYSYTVKEGFEDTPVNHVSYWDAARFANWLTNGQPVGVQGMDTTETGMYFLGGVTHPDLNATLRNETAWEAGGVAIASMDEWVKAGHYDPTKGDAGDYWHFPTRSDTLPTPSLPNTTNPNSANCENVVGSVTEVGAYTLARSYYGTFDQGGNVWEWVERGYPQQLGGSFMDTAWALGVTHLSGQGPTTEAPVFGFRVSSLMPIGESPPIEFVEVELQRSVDLMNWESVALSADLISEDGNLRIPVEEDVAFYRLSIRRPEREE